MANITITGLASASPLTGSEVLPVDQGGFTLKTTVQDIANLAGGGGTASFGVAQLISPLSGSTYDLTTLFPSVTFTNKTISMQMQAVTADGAEGSNSGSYFFNIIRNNSSFPSWNYSSPYSSMANGMPSPVSFMFGGTEASPTINFFISGGYSVSVNMTLVTV